MSLQNSLLNALDSPPVCEAPPVPHDDVRAPEPLSRLDNLNDTATIMIVDDEPINIKVVQKHLKEGGYERFITTTDSREAFDMVRRERPDVVVLDIVMPHVSGLHILEAIRGDIHVHYLPVLILTASTDEETRLESLRLGATDFLAKPVKPSELVPRVRNALVLKAHHDHLLDYSARLEARVCQRTSELAQSRWEVIHVLARAAECRDEDTGNHVLRVGHYTGIIARELGFSDARVEMLEQAATLHDVGKIGIPDAILLKPGKLNDKEFATMRNHSEYGMRILSGITSHASIHAEIQCQSPVLRMAATIAMSHHEKWDGSGYPQGLLGEAIPLEGRITAVADVFDALGSRRPYKEPIPRQRCIDILKEGRGSHFDPRVLDAFFARVDEISQVAHELGDE